MTEDFSLGTAQGFVDARRERDRKFELLRAELQQLEDGLPTFVADVGAFTLDRLVRLMIVDRSFTDKQVRAVHQLLSQQDAIEGVELRLLEMES